jgi:hypothetical protein
VEPHGQNDHLLPAWRRSSQHGRVAIPPGRCVFHEVTGVLTVVAAIFAAYSANQFLTKTRKLPPAAGGIQLAASAARAHTPAAAGRPTPPQLSGE